MKDEVKAALQEAMKYIEEVKRHEEKERQKIQAELKKMRDEALSLFDKEYNKDILKKPQEKYNPLLEKIAAKYNPLLEEIAARRERDDKLLKEAKKAIERMDNSRLNRSVRE